MAGNGVILRKQIGPTLPLGLVICGETAVDNIHLADAGFWINQRFQEANERYGLTGIDDFNSRRSLTSTIQPDINSHTFEREQFPVRIHFG